MVDYERVIGIDLGTTNSVVAIREGNETTVIANFDGGRLTPSVVGFKEKERYIGEIAKRQAILNPTNTVYSIKRFMGRRGNEVTKADRELPYKIVGNPMELVGVQIDEKTYSPQEISAMILSYLKKSAEEYLGGEVKKAVITVPAYFNDSQRQATKEAGKIAGLEVLRIINEPTAAALAYGLDSKREGKIAIYDFGGGTFDISILDYDQKEKVLTVLSTNGDTRLGGDDFDNRIIDLILAEFSKNNPDCDVKLKDNPAAMQRIREFAEVAKKELSFSSKTTINLPFLISDSKGKVYNFIMDLTRAKFESMIEDLITKTVGLSNQALTDAGLKPEQIKDVVLVGGSTRIPAIRELIKKIFKTEKLNCSVNPDEVVAIGAAIQAGIISGSVNEVLLLDVTPLTLGIETYGGLMSALIKRGTVIPITRTEIFSTAHDNQPAVDIHILQGERSFAKDNRTLGRFQLDGLPLAARGVPKIEVRFDIDANGILSVLAKDLATGKEKNIKVQYSSGLTEKEIEKMSQEAEQFEKEDLERKNLVEKKVSLESLFSYATKFMAEDVYKTVPENLQEKYKKVVNNLIKAKDSNDKQLLDESIKTFTDVSNEIAEYIYTVKDDKVEDKEPTDKDLKDIEESEDK